jgi:S1-C subfamily serine protease
VAVAEDLDLAVLQVRRPPGDDAKFISLCIARSDGLRLGQPLRALGFPEYEFQAAAGEIVSLIHGSHVHDAMQLMPRIDRDTGREIILVSGTTPGPVMRLQHSAATGHGSSGSPLVDQRGHVVGVAYALLSGDTSGTEAEPAAPGLNLGIASNVLRRFLDVHAIPYEEGLP